MSIQYFTMCTYRKFRLFLFIVGHLSWFWVLQIVDCASISIGIQMFFHYTASVSLNVHPEMVLMVCMAGLDAWRNAMFFSSHINMHVQGEFPCLHTSPVLDSFTSFAKIYSYRSEVKPHLSFDIHFSGDYWCWAFFHTPVDHLHVFFYFVAEFWCLILSK